MGKVAEEHGFSQSGLALQDDLAPQGGLKRRNQHRSLTSRTVAHFGVGIVSGFVECGEASVAEEGVSERREQAAAQRGRPGEQEANVAETENATHPRVPKKNGLHNPRAWV